MKESSSADTKSIDFKVKFQKFSEAVIWDHYFQLELGPYTARSRPESNRSLLNHCFPVLESRTTLAKAKGRNLETKITDMYDAFVHDFEKLCAIFKQAVNNPQSCRLFRCHKYATALRLR